MTKSRAILKTAAVLNAALLFGGYVWYRGGGTYADGPEPAVTLQKEDPKPVIVELSDEQKKMLLSGSKSEKLFTSRPPPARQEEGRMMLGGPKSMRVIENPAATVEPRQTIMSGSKNDPVILTKPAEASKPSAIMKSTKVMVIDWDESKPLEKTVPAQHKKRVIMSGSKSAVAFPESSRQPEAKPIAPDAKPETPIRERMILLPGSKSSPFREFEENEARRKHLQQKQAQE